MVDDNVAANKDVAPIVDTHNFQVDPGSTLIPQSDASMDALQAEAIASPTTQDEQDSSKQISSLSHDEGSSEKNHHVSGAANGNRHGNDRNERGKANHPPSPTAVQDMFLNGLRRENIDVVLYFCDGSQERGVVRAFDTFTLLVENRSNGKVQLVYKHSVARIFPVRTPPGSRRSLLQEPRAERRQTKQPSLICAIAVRRNR